MDCDIPAAETSLKDIEQKAFRDSMQDGLMEAMIGIVLLGMAAASVSLVFIAAYIMPLIFWGPISEAVRKRYTYPRIGYVKLRTDPARKVLPGVFLYQLAIFGILGVALFIIFGDVANAEHWHRSMPLVFSLMLVGACLYTADKSGSKCPYLYASVSVVSGCIFSVLEFKDLEFPFLFGELGTGLVLYFIFMGSIMVSTGIGLFVYFLHRHPQAPDEDLTGC